VLQALDRDAYNYGTHARTKGILARRLHVYFIWNPDIHHESSEFEWRKTRKREASGASQQTNASSERCVNMRFLSEFESLMAGAQAHSRPRECNRAD